MSIQLEQMVQSPTWKQVLLELIITEKIDPWNVDIVKIAEGFLNKIKEMKTLELFIPANMILASAILLRYKSQVIDLNEQPQVFYDEGTEETIEKPVIAELTPIARIPPKRQITFTDLVEELDKLMEYEEKRGKIEKERVETVLNLKIEGIDIEKQMNEVYNMILDNMNGGEYVLFSNLISEKKNKREIVHVLLSVLHLTQESKIEIQQKKLFEDIEIVPIREKN
ncbi:MAG: segregation/condensation protein A [Candidatus ainarchaeum sp.]|nr:segregation/condensation protein A [Candidatus ainarchaeum sp.]